MIPLLGVLSMGLWSLPTLIIGIIGLVLTTKHRANFPRVASPAMWGFGFLTGNAIFGGFLRSFGMRSYYPGSGGLFMQISSLVMSFPGWLAWIFILVAIRRALVEVIPSEA